MHVIELSFKNEELQNLKERNQALEQRALEAEGKVKDLITESNQLREEVCPDFFPFFCLILWDRSIQGFCDSLSCVHTKIMKDLDVLAHTHSCERE